MSAPKKVKKKSITKANVQLPALHPHAAGIDIGANQIQVAVPCDADPKPVRTFTTFTDDLFKLRDWLKACGVRTVAMESTGVYWIALYQTLEAAGIEVCLVNARHCKNLPGRKTDVSDCQWLQYLHSVGLLRASFRPPEQICVVRSFLRQRANLVRYASQQVMQLHKALTQMNVQIHNVISDIVGVTGLAILDAVLAGERDGQKLAQLKDHRIKASGDTIARSLVGDWRAEHLFALRQALATWRHYQQLITECDEATARALAGFESRVDVSCQPAAALDLAAQKAACQRAAFRGADGTLPDHRGGVDTGAGAASRHGAGAVWRTGAGLRAAISDGEVFCLVAGTVPGQPDHGRAGDLGENARREEPVGGGVAVGRAVPVAEQDVSRRLFPPLEGAAGHTQSHHRDGAQAGAHPLAPAQIPGSLRPKSLDGGRRKTADQEVETTTPKRHRPRLQTCHGGMNLHA